MTLRWIPLDRLEPHPENANRMPPRLLEKLKAHIARTGRYEPLVVRPLPRAAPEPAPQARPTLREGPGPAAEPPGPDGKPEAEGPDEAAPQAHRTAVAALPAERPAPTEAADAGTVGPGDLRYQILNGHHRA